ncbi:MAG: DUF882 domain-containing protein [Alphaproteobacteria bacterium]|nr:DUF882 domain-containing protein [Alphaproteobacteria bacterium]
MLTSQASSEDKKLEIKEEFPYDPIPSPPPFDPIPTEQVLPEPELIDPMDILNAHPPVPSDKADLPMDVKPAKPQKKTGSRRLKLYSLHTGESVDVEFWRNGKYIPSGLKELNHILRDHRSGDEIDMDPELFSLVHRLYTDLGATGAIHIISGHRSAKTNAMLKSIGRKVAKKSQHILGTAMDIRIPGIPIKKIRDTALSYKAGGVGYYPTSKFVHVDTGRPRQW